MATTTIDVLADSEGAGTIFNYAQSRGGKGSWAELTSQYLAAIPGLGPVISPGARFVHLGLMPFPTGEWTFSGAFSTVASTDAFDRLPHGYGKYGSGSGLVATYTVPLGWPPITCFELWWVDLAGGGDNSYSIDGGAQTNFGQTRNGNNKLSKFFVNSPITSTITIRMANAAGTSQLGMPAGITPYFADPRGATTGVIVNNFGSNGATLHAAVAATSGDRLAVFDDVQLGTGSPIPVAPNIAVMLFVNDIIRANDTEWGTDETTLATRLNLGTKLVLVGAWAIETTDYNLTQQGLYRTKTGVIAGSTGSTFLDINASWVARGYADVTAQGAAFLQDSLHPKQAGHFAIADLVTGTIRNKCLTATVAGNLYAFTVGQSYVGPQTMLGGFASFITTDAGARASETDTGQPGIAASTAAGARAPETDTANVGVPKATPTGQLATETDTANAGSTTTTVVGARATETDTGNAGMPTTATGGTQGTETDTANAGTVLSLVDESGSALTDEYGEPVTDEYGDPIIGGPPPDELDLANNGTTVVSAAGQSATETDSGNSGTVLTVVVGAVALETNEGLSGSGAIPGAQATETGTANAGTVAVVAVGALATATNTANAATIVTTVVGAQAVEACTSNTGTPTSTAVGTQASETATPNTGTLTATVAGAVALEIDTALPTDGSTATGTQGEESDTANAGTVITTAVGARATETDTPNIGVFTAAATGAQAVESDEAFSSEAATVGGVQSSESDAANAGTIVTVVVGAQAIEADVPNVGTPTATVAGARASETDTAFSSDGSTVTGAQGSETDTGNPGTIVTVVIGQRATETCTGNTGTSASTAVGARATETDIPNIGALVAYIPGERATETDSVLAGVPRITIPGNRATELDEAFSQVVVASGIGHQRVSWSSDQRVTVENDQRVSIRGRR